ncbi:MAG: Mur ligase family protein [Gemmatimonadota bacterium]
MDRPFLDPLFDRLFPPLPSGVHWGLERMEAALAELGNPERCAPALHVGGTNGKGSVASTLASVLTRSGKRVGLYTSPHLCSLTERFQVDGRPASPRALERVAEEIRGTVVSHGLTFFEAATLLAFRYFQSEEVDVQVVEVGLGGRLDATNVICPQVSVLTNVALDHADFLGDTLEAIAGEKAGILKTGVPAVTAEVKPGPLGVFRRRARAVGAPLTELDPEREIRALEVTHDRTRFTVDTVPWGELQVDTPLVGEHQAVNAALAIRALEQLPEELRPASPVEVREGIRDVQWPGRDQIRVVEGTEWIFDVAHNTAGVRSLVRVLDGIGLPRPRVALLGVLGDKTWGEMLPPLLQRVDGAILTQPQSAPDGRRWDPREAARVVESALEPERRPWIRVETDFSRALDQARSASHGGTVVVTGSCHTVGDALRIMRLEPFPPPAP